MYAESSLNSMSYGSGIRQSIVDIKDRDTTSKGGTSETVLAYNMENGP